MRISVSLIGVMIVPAISTSSGPCDRIPEGEYRFMIAEGKHLSIDVGQSAETFWVDLTRDPEPWDDDSGLGSDLDEELNSIPHFTRKRIDYILESDCSINIAIHSTILFKQILNDVSPLVGVLTGSGAIMAQYDAAKSAIILGGWMELERLVDNSVSRPIIRQSLRQGYYIYTSRSGIACMILVMNAINLDISCFLPSIGSEPARHLSGVTEYVVHTHDKVSVKAGGQMTGPDFNDLASVLNEIGDVVSSELILRYDSEAGTLSAGSAIFKLDSSIAAK